MNIRTNDKVRLNVGCGQTRPEGWINTDCSLNSLAQNNPLLRPLARRLIKSVAYGVPAYYMNLNRRWKFAAATVDVVYASHVFEHLLPSTAEFFLAEAQRVLKPGGVIRIVIPDLLQLSRRYVAAYEAGKAEASQEFLWALNLHLTNTCPEGGARLKKFAHWWQGYPHQHKYMYDMRSLKAKLVQHSFRDLRECSYGGSSHLAEIAQVEYGAEGVPAIYVEALK